MSSYEIVHLDELDQPIPYLPVPFDGGVSVIDPTTPKPEDLEHDPVTGVIRAAAATVVDNETPEYEITSGGASETWDPTKPTEGPTMDPVSLARLRLQQLKVVRRLMKKQKHALQLGEHHVKKVAKGRRKKRLEKASRKRNRR